MLFIYILLILAVIYWLINRSVEGHQRWGHSFENMSFSADEFYTLVHKPVDSKKIENISITRTTYSEGGILSANREYLHIVWEEYIVDICAAPFGTDFFVSTWLVYHPSVIKKLMRRIELLASRANRETYYQTDTAAMFKGAVHGSVLSAIEQMTTSKGARALNDIEKQFA